MNPQLLQVLSLLAVSAVNGEAIKESVVLGADGAVAADGVASVNNAEVGANGAVSSHPSKPREKSEQTWHAPAENAVLRVHGAKEDPTSSPLQAWHTPPEGAVLRVQAEFPAPAAPKLVESFPAPMATSPKPSLAEVHTSVLNQPEHAPVLRVHTHQP